MTDQCKHCIFRGDLKGCQSAECHKHDDWYSVQLNKRIAELETMLESRTKEVDSWITRFDKAVNKQRLVTNALKAECEDYKETLLYCKHNKKGQGVRINGVLWRWSDDL